MRSIILHGHLFKNAGSTFDWSLRRCFNDDFIDHRDDIAMRQGGTELLTSIILDNPKLKAISSHVMPTMSPIQNGINFLPIFFLRHPIIRVRSVYDFELRQKPAKTPGAIEAKKKNFKDYVRWRLDRRVGAIIRNYHCRYLAGLRRRGPSTEGDEEDFERAVQRLSEIPVTPIVEKYDASMILLEELLVKHFPEIDLAYIPQNVSKKGASETLFKEKEEKLSNELGEVYPELIAANQFDLILYEKAVRLLNQHLKNTESLSMKLSDFQSRCSTLISKQRSKPMSLRKTLTKTIKTAWNLFR